MTREMIHENGKIIMELQLDRKIANRRIYPAIGFDLTTDIEKILIHELRPKNRIRKIKNIFN